MAADKPTLVVGEACPASPLMGDIAGQRLGEGVVLDLEGHEVPLRAIYQQGPVVLVWLRHYG